MMTNLHRGALSVALAVCLLALFSVRSVRLSASAKATADPPKPLAKAGPADPRDGPAKAGHYDYSDAQEPPREWIDPDTGHRVVRLSDEPGSQSMYFGPTHVFAVEVNSSRRGL